MALIQCPECGKRVSDMANACPDCGFPLHAKSQSSIQQVQPKEVPVIIERESRLIGGIVAGNVYIDNRLIGTIKSGQTLTTAVTLGRHSVMTDTNVSHGNLFAPLATSTAREGTEFNVTESTTQVRISIGFKSSFTNSTGKLVVNNVVCR